MFSEAKSKLKSKDAEKPQKFLKNEVKRKYNDPVMLRVNFEGMECTLATLLSTRDPGPSGVSADLDQDLE